MRTDTYTKTMLTVIAACLIYLCLGRPAVFPTAQAQAQQTHVILDGWSYGTDTLAILGTAGVSFRQELSVFA